MRNIHIIILVWVMATGSALAYTQPAPSFEKDSPWSRRDPTTDLDLDLFYRSWKDSPVVIGHGGFHEQAILEAGNALNPPGRGKCLVCLTEYSHGFLPTGGITESVTTPRRQTCFIVLGGEGIAYCAGDKAVIREGTGVFMPAGLTYRFENTGDGPLEVLFFSEDITEEFEPAKAMEIGTYRESVPSAGPSWHWSHVNRGILNCSWENPIWFGVVTLDAFEIAQPHVAPIGIEEIWMQLTGTGLMYFGNRLFRHESGTAFYIPPTYKVPHSSINPSDKPMTWLYLGIRLDNDIPVTTEMQELIDSLTLED